MSSNAERIKDLEKAVETITEKLVGLAVIENKFISYNDQAKKARIDLDEKFLKILKIRDELIKSEWEMLERKAQLKLEFRYQWMEKLFTKRSCD